MGRTRICIRSDSRISCPCLGEISNACLPLPLPLPVLRDLAGDVMYIHAYVEETIYQISRHAGALAGGLESQPSTMDCV